MDERLQQGTGLILDHTLHLAYRLANPRTWPVKPLAMIKAEKLPWQMAGSERGQTHPLRQPLMPEHCLSVAINAWANIMLHSILMAMPLEWRIHQLA